MPLSLKKWGMSALYGLVDIGTEFVDQTMKLPASGTFQNATDIQRAAAVGGGAALAYFGRGSMAEVGETIALSATPLLEKSAANAILSLMGNPTRFASGGGRGQILTRRPGAGPTPGAPGGVAGAFY